MTATDRTEELIRAMLERRAGGNPPGWLADRTMHAVTTVAQVRRGRGWPVRLPESSGSRVALVAVPGLLVVLLGMALVAGGRQPGRPEPAPSRPTAVIGPSSAPPGSRAPAPISTPPASSEPVPSMGPVPGVSAPPPATPRPVAAHLAPDAIAAVTKDGDSLRVRSLPGLGRDSLRLEPLLPTGTRMLVLDGPVDADGDDYDWYEVLVLDEPMYGWVASGKGSEAWIRLATPDCPAALDGRAVATLEPAEVLACFGDAEVAIRAWPSEGQGGADTHPCQPFEDGSACETRNGWLFPGVGATALAFEPRGGPTASIEVAIPAGLAPSVAGASPTAPIDLLIAMDHPDARACAVRNPDTGEDLVPRGEAVIGCRLTWVVLGVAWDPTAWDRDQSAGVVARGASALAPAPQPTPRADGEEPRPPRVVPALRRPGGGRPARRSSSAASGAGRSARRAGRPCRPRRPCGGR